MAKIIFNTRDELISLDTDNIAVVQADGNYSRVFSINHRETIITMGISRVEEAIMEAKGRSQRFVRLGRSLVINHSLLYRINVLKGVVVLSDGMNEIKLAVSKDTLKSYKNAISKSIKIKNVNNETDSVGK